MNRDSFARNAVAVYLREMAEVRGHGTPETAHYEALTKLLKTVGGKLKPKVSVIQQPRDTGHGTPDFGFYTAAQIRRGKNRGVADEKPERGVAEIKTLSADIGQLLASEQTKKYLRGYGLVLASNYRQFALVENNDGKPKEIPPRFTLADSEDDFWEKAKHSRNTAAEFGGRLCEFLRRALLHNAPITTAADVAKHLASYARDTLELLENSKEEEAMRPLRKDLESMLSMTFSGKKGDHFFHSTLAQSIYYGLFSAWLQTPGIFDWKTAAHSANPVMGALFGYIAGPGQLGKLNLAEQLDGAAAMLNRVQDKETLFGGIDAASAIQHFYEPFVAEYDPKLRKTMGVWYTPPEVVQYMVERADRVLRTELNIPDGLANEEVYVLDPCGGTGAYIAETLRRIHKTCKERHGDIAGEMTKKAAQERIISFEIMSAPYLVAHWQVETLLKELGAPLGKGERAAIYLANSLTDWDDPDPERMPLIVRLLQQERDAVDKIKQESPILVVLGNPPYNAFAGTSPKQEKNLVAPYKEGLRKKWKVGKFNLDELYVRFFRMAQNRIVGRGKGLVSFISNHSYIKDLSFVVMRESLLGSFNKIWIDDLNGDSRETGKTTPEGAPDPSIFSTPMNQAGIQVGTAIGMYLSAPSGKESGVLFRNFWGTKKREELLESLDTEESAEFDSRYEAVNPEPWNKFSFRPMSASNDFLRWPSIDELYESMSNGMVEARGGALFDIDRAALEARMRDYFDSSINWETYKRMGGGLAKNAARFDAQKTRQKVLDASKFETLQIANYTMRPFDDGSCYYTGIRPVWNEHRPRLWHEFKPGNSFLVSRFSSSVSDEGTPVFFTRGLCDYGVMGSARCMPFRLYKEDKKKRKVITTNLSEKAKNYLSALGFADPDRDMEAGESFWLHALAVCCAPDYQTENAKGLRSGWPRIPLPPNAETFKQSATLGAKVRDLMDMKNSMNHNSPQVRALLPLAHFVGDPGDRLLDNSWGHDNNGKTFPGQGKIKPQTANADYPTALGAPLKIFFNEEAHWEKVPTRVWNYRIGRVQPPKKWLSYRAAAVLGRPLQAFEINTFADIIRRISVLISMEAELNANYRAAKEE